MGDKYRLLCQARDTELTVRAMPVRVDLDGDCTLVVGDDGAVRLLELRLVADLPDAGGAEDGGTITVELADGGSGEHPDAIVVGLTMVIEQPGGTARLVSRQPARFEGRTAAVPPPGGDHELAGPVDFVLGSDGDVTAAQIRDLTLTFTPAD